MSSRLLGHRFAKRPADLPQEVLWQALQHQRKDLRITTADGLQQRDGRLVEGRTRIEQQPHQFGIRCPAGRRFDREQLVIGRRHRAVRRLKAGLAAAHASAGGDQPPDDDEARRRGVSPDTAGAEIQERPPAAPPARLVGLAGVGGKQRGYGVGVGKGGGEVQRTPRQIRHPVMAASIGVVTGNRGSRGRASRPRASAASGSSSACFSAGQLE